MVNVSVERIETHLTIDSPDRTALDLLPDAAGLSRQRIKHAMTQGAVWLTRGKQTQRLRRAKRVLNVGDELHLYYDEKVLSEIPPEPVLVADVGGYSVWNKGCGLRSQGSKWGDHCTLVRWAEQNLEPERSAFTVHRLDRAATGLMLVAHSKKLAAALSQLFQERAVEKRYRAIVSGDFSSQPNPARVTTPVDGKDAVSEFVLQDVIDDGQKDGTTSAIDVCIETGRKHQVRRHLAELGFPIVGDRLYGSAAADDVDLQLTAYLLAFQCPITDLRVEYRL